MEVESKILFCNDFDSIIVDSISSVSNGTFNLGLASVRLKLSIGRNAQPILTSLITAMTNA